MEVTTTMKKTNVNSNKELSQGENKKISRNKTVKVTFSNDDANFIKEIAETLNISEAEVLRKGVKLMNLYSKAYSDPNVKMILEKTDTRQEVLIL